MGQIKDVFTKGKAAAVTETRTKDIMRGDPTGEKKEGLISLTNELEQNLKDLKDLDKQQTSLNEELMDAMMGFRKAEGSTDSAKPFRTPGMDYKRKSSYRVPGGSMYAEGNLRTAMREFLKTEVKEGRLKLGERDMFRIEEYSPLSEDDPIDVFRRYYGEDALEAASNMASKLEKGTSFKNYEEIFRANMPELKVKTEGAGQYDQSIIDAEAAMKQAAEDEKNLKKLEEFDVEGRTKNSKGGINRVGFARGKIKLAQFLYGKGTDLVTEIRKAVNNIMESGDRKVDADVAVDDMFDELGIDRDTVDQKDVLKAYDEAYKTLSIPPGSRGGPEDIAAPVQSAEESMKELRKQFDKDVEEAGGMEAFLDDNPIGDKKPTGNIKYKQGDVITSENFGDTPFAPDTTNLKKAKEEFNVEEGLDDLDNLNLGSKKGDVVSRQLKIMRLAEDIQPGLFEKLTDTQLDIIVKYGDRIDRDLLKNIVLDPDPNNQAAALATLDEVQTLMDKGMNIDEIMSTLQSTPRRKQAEGGLSYLMGM